MRAFAVFMMVQGHTIHALLADQYRNFDSLIYFVWYSFRGFTAPIFMFTAGTVFTFLLTKNNLPFGKNPRVYKGIKRFLILIFIGYILRYPTHRIFDFSNVTEAQWKIFFSIDALHLIGFGLLFIIFLFALSRLVDKHAKWIYLVATLLIFIPSPWINAVNWMDMLPKPVAPYLYSGTGSLFPFFPWLGYMFAGAMFGNYLVFNRGVYRENKFSRNLLFIGFVLVLLSTVLNQSGNFLDYYDTQVTASIGLSSYRLGVVIILCGIVSYISNHVNNVPYFIRVFGKHSLVIYVIHLVIVYGSAFMPGLSYLFGKSFSFPEVIVIAGVMEIAMIVLSLIIEEVAKKWKGFSLSTLIRKIRLQWE